MFTKQLSINNYQDSYEIKTEIIKQVSKELSINKKFSNNFHPNRFDMNILYEAARARQASIIRRKEIDRKKELERLRIVREQRS